VVSRNEWTQGLEGLVAMEALVAKALVMVQVVLIR
jgi:hypothetical protein